MSIEQKLIIELYNAGLRMADENLKDAVEMIEMDIEELKISEDEAIKQWLKDTLTNYPECFTK